MDHHLDLRGVQGGQIALQVDHHIVLALGVDGLQRRPDAVGPRWQVRVGQHRLTPMGFDDVHDLRFARRHHHRAEPGGLGLLPDPHDHGQARDIGQRLGRQPGRSHAGGDQKDRIHRVFGGLFFARVPPGFLCPPV